MTNREKELLEENGQLKQQVDELKNRLNCVKLQLQVEQASNQTTWEALCNLRKQYKNCRLELEKERCRTQTAVEAVNRGLDGS